MTVTTVSPANRAPAAPSPGSAYPVKSNNVPPFDGAGMTTAQIMNILHSLDSGAVAEAGAAYTNLGHELGTMAVKLTQQAQTLAQNWTGSAARAAMTSFQQLHDQTSALASQAAQTGSALTWLGTQVLPKFQQLGGLDTGLSGSAATAAQAQAQRYISALSNYLVTANGYLPDQIGGVASSTAGGDPLAKNSAAKNSAASSSGGSSGTAAPGASGLSVGVAGGPGAAGVANSRQAAGADGAASGPGDSDAVPGADGSAAGTGNAGGTSLSGSAAGGNVPGATPAGATPAGSATPAPAVSRLQSATPVPDSTPGAAAAPAPTAPSAAAGTGDLGAGAVSPFSPLPVLPGLSGASGNGGGGGGGGRGNRAAASEAGDPAAGIQPGVPGAPVPEAPGLDGGLAEGAAPSVVTAVTADGPVAPGSGDSPGHGGLGAMPMAGGAPGLSEKERARRVWASEDENIWGLPADCVPPVIGPGRPAP
jgi:hypothetical protein